jgi:hypothetical protein
VTPGQTVATSKERYRLTGRGLKTRWFTVFDAELEGGGAVVVKALGFPRGPHAERFVELALTLTQVSSPHVVQVLDAGFHEGTAFVVEEVAREGEAQNTVLPERSRGAHPGHEPFGGLGGYGVLRGLALAVDAVSGALRVPAISPMRALQRERLRHTEDGVKLSVLSPSIFPVLPPEPDWTWAELSVLAPEVARREKADPRDDVFALCALALEQPLVTDELSARALISGDLAVDIADPVLRRGLSMNRALRFASAAELAAALR